MKRLSRIQNLFEQEADATATAEETGSKIKLIKSVSLPNPQIQVQWDYTYSWPEKNPLLGSVAEFVKTLKTSTKGDAKAILDIITKAEANSAIGITRAAGNTQNTRLFGKNLSQTTGSIFLFKPSLITASKIPADKNVGDINGNPVFSIEGRVMDAIKPYMDSDVANSNTGVSSKTVSQKTTKVFTQIDGDAHDWYVEFSANYMIPIANKIGDSEVPISTSGKITQIFWDFMVVAPLGFNTAYDQSSGKDIYSQKLKDSISRLLGEAGKIDPVYASVDTSILSKYLFEHIVKATLVLCLNKGILVKSNLENNFVPVAIQKPMQGAKNAAVGMQAGSPANSPSSGTSNASTVTATAGFDGTAINNEMDLAKVISGTWIGYGTKPNEVDSLDKVKTVYNEWLKKLPSAAVTTFDEIKAKLPFTKSDAALISTKEFNALQYFIVNTQDKPYGPQTEAAVKAGFEKSSIK
jgi:hypothetical protein